MTTENTDATAEAEATATAEEAAAAAEKAADEAAAKAAADAAAKEAENTAGAEGQEEGSEGSEEEEAWETTGNDTADAVLTLLQESGISQEAAKALMWDAIKEGDPSKIDEKELADKMGSAAQAKLAIKGVQAFVKEQADETAAALAEITAVAGSEKNWKTVVGWANKNLQESDLSEIREMIDRGGRSRASGVRELVALYNEKSGETTIGGTAPVTPKQGNGRPPAKKPGLSAEEFKAEMAKVDKLPMPRREPMRAKLIADRKARKRFEGN